MVRPSDVLVIGGGPAGLAAAIAVRQKGFAVCLADPARPPIDKTCGEGLLPGAVEALAQLGVELEGVPFPGIRFTGEGNTVGSRFSRGWGLGVRRTRLQEGLIKRAVDLGVELHWGAAVRGIHNGEVAFDDGRVKFPWIVAADGENSRVRAWAGLDGSWFHLRRFGFRRHYRVGAVSMPDGGFMEVHWGPSCQLYVTPVGEREICVVAMSRDPHLRLDDVLKRIPPLADRLRGAQAITTERGAVSASRRLRKVQRGNLALIGDASGSVDAVTGEGLRLSFEQSLALADSMARGDLRLYEVAHRRLISRPLLMAGLMLSMDRSSFLRRRTLYAMSREPQLFSNMLASHIGELSIPAFARRGMIPLTRAIFTA